MYYLYLAIVCWFVATLPYRWGRYINAAIAIDIIGYVFAGAMVKCFSEERYGPTNNNSGYAIEPRLKPWLSAWMTPDNSLLGDDGWKKKWAAKGIDVNTWWPKVRWLWRNCGYGARWTFLGAPVDPFIDEDMEVEGDAGINRTTREGYFMAHYHGYWQYKLVKRIPGTNRCLMWNFGWGLDTYVGNPARTLDQPRALLMISPRFPKFEPRK